MKAKGTCIKVIEAESGLHHQVVNDTIKTLKKFRRNRSVKSVKVLQPQLESCMLPLINNYLEYVGSPWFAENELDVHFIEELPQTQHRAAATDRRGGYILLAGLAQQLYPPDHAGYEHPCDILVFLKCSGILKVSLTLADIQMTMDEDDGDGDGGVVEMWMQKGVSGENTPGVYWNYVPCGRGAFVLWQVAGV
ncbi:hypothetical protein BC830DRAFT_1163101 [Chytriomyces sp. MP71]|nr:hypothetical protein BC830DRAFT_1163101 [Chytriomyces sp. MP71]